MWARSATGCWRARRTTSSTCPRRAVSRTTVTDAHRRRRRNALSSGAMAERVPPPPPPGREPTLEVEVEPDTGAIKLPPARGRPVDSGARTIDRRTPPEPPRKPAPPPPAKPKATRPELGAVPSEPSVLLNPDPITLHPDPSSPHAILVLPSPPS